VDTYGAGWDLVQCEHPENIVVHGNVNSRGCLDMISQSKISINVMPWFKNGAHDRVFNSMLNGAAVVSDPSIYLESCFDKSSILFYDLKQLKTKEGCEKLGNDVKELLADKDRLEQMISNAYRICENSHTWACRTNQFIDNCLNLMV
jgi:outer membrane murein-binding lipoprotein Lpp